MSELEIRAWTSSAHQSTTTEGGAPTGTCETQWTPEQHAPSVCDTRRANSPSRWPKAGKLELGATCPCQKLCEVQVRTGAGGVSCACECQKGGGPSGYRRPGSEPRATPTKASAAPPTGPSAPASHLSHIHAAQFLKQWLHNPAMGHAAATLSNEAVSSVY